MGVASIKRLLPLHSAFNQSLHFRPTNHEQSLLPLHLMNNLIAQVSFLLFLEYGAPAVLSRRGEIA
jgi:hypothetical protein